MVKLIRIQTWLLLIVLVTIASHPGYCQLETYPCDENEYPFTLVPEQTLCEQYPNFVCSQQIGVGTSITHSSQIGNDITGNICIVGDFIVDNHFIFNDAIIKINQGVKIFTWANTQLTIDHSKLFSCNGLWKGIELGEHASIITKSSSNIEDAEIAILAIGDTELEIKKTTFNRNRIGIDAVGVTSTAFPTFKSFRLNTFSCTAPLNGTIDEITTAGVRMKNTPLNTVMGSQASLNWFRDIIYGIHVTGGLSSITTSGIFMERIKKDGIFMEEGLLTISNSTFTNCEEIGINITTAKNVNIHSVWAKYNTQIPETTNVRKGVSIGGFALNAYVKFVKYNLNADFEETSNKVQGIFFSGSEVGAGTSIEIDDSDFNFTAKNSRGIFFNNGLYPTSSTTKIWGNRFQVSTSSGPSSFNQRSTGLELRASEHNNFSIKWNTFTSNVIVPSPYFQNSIGIYLGGNSLNGINNEISVNSFNYSVEYLKVCIYANPFPNIEAV